MGQADLERLFKVYYEINFIKKKHNLLCNFKIDTGSFETAIEFTAIGYHHPPKSKNWNELKQSGNDILCPDLLDYHNRIIIEYEEEPRPGKKGHTEESKRDEKRDYFYRIGGFRLFKVWESDGVWKEKLEKFLLSIKI